ncbi:phosphatase domain-containing putative toxin [Pseudomonas syringae group genomosp. 3]|uniref:Type III effector HopAO1 n=6 Tax=Pseudomonas syringae group TaxID=136849 RepID=A0AB38EMU9_9PSED|nr:tyrosine protein phosphatase [Pseudomonas syringae group genomosp. 3]SOQ16058.1 type III effector HopAO1 [Pseudomonas syringae pv. persicae]SOQ16418.1 type III effector HopAO1 [Pseudomonas syringae pv. persicae]
MQNHVITSRGVIPLSRGGSASDLEPAYAQLTPEAYRHAVTKFKQALTTPERPTGEPVFLYDRTPGELENFRSSDSFILPPHLNQKGWDTLHISGSASIASLEQVQRLHATPESPVVVLDVREESHAIVGGYPCTWRLGNNWANVGKSRNAVIADEQSRIAALKQQPTVEIIHRKDAKHGLENPRKVVLKNPDISSEEDLVKSAGADYLRLMVTDHMGPRSEDIDLFLAMERALPEHGRVHIHCGVGQGRTGIFIAMHDMLKNAHHVSFHDLIERQLAFNPGRALDFNKDVTHEGRANLRNDRLEFISLFYEYAKQNPKGAPRSWSEWLADPNTPLNNAD